MLRWLFFLLIGLSYSTVEACTCAYLPLESDAVRRAKQIFIFRLVAAGIDEDKPDLTFKNETIGRIKVVSQLRGSSKHVSEVSFFTDQCCGIRLDVGGYFVAFLPQTGKRFVANNGNVMQVGRTFSHEDTIAKVQAVLTGKNEFEAEFSRADTDRTEQDPVLPPCIQPGTRLIR